MNQNLTAKKLAKFWRDEYKKEFGSAYTPIVSALYDMQYFSELAKKDIDSFLLLLTIKEAISRSMTSPRYLVESFSKYIPDIEYPEEYFYVQTKGGKEQKDIWRKYEMLHTSWFPNPEDDEKKLSYIQQIRDWIDGIKLQSN